MLKLHSSSRHTDVVAEHALDTGSGVSDERPAKDASSLIARAFRAEWLGQTVASVCWITSVFAYGISSVGDVLQLAAASAWLFANIAALVAREPQSP